MHGRVVLLGHRCSHNVGERLDLVREEAEGVGRPRRFDDRACKKHDMAVVSLRAVRRSVDELKQAG